MATEQDLIRYLKTHSEREYEREDFQSEADRQLKRRNLIEFLRFLKERTCEEPPG
jgi:hypothetical protein